jgi:hypothetical protein
MAKEKKAEEVKAEVVGSDEKPAVMAIIALIAGILSVLCHCVPIAGSAIGFLLSVAAIVLGIIEFNKIKKGESSEKGRGMCLAGIILGGVGIVFGIIVLVFTILGIFGGVLGGLFDYYNYY